MTLGGDLLGKKPAWRERVRGPQGDKPGEGRARCGESGWSVGCAVRAQGEEVKLSLRPAFTGLNVQIRDSGFILSEKEVIRRF